MEEQIKPCDKVETLKSLVYGVSQKMRERDGVFKINKNKIKIKVWVIS